jgi:hypothetical protein
LADEEVLNENCLIDAYEFVNTINNENHDEHDEKLLSAQTYEILILREQ